MDNFSKTLWLRILCKVCTFACAQGTNLIDVPSVLVKLKTLVNSFHLPYQF